MWHKLVARIYIYEIFFFFLNPVTSATGFLMWQFLVDESAEKGALKTGWKLLWHQSYVRSGIILLCQANQTQDKVKTFGTLGKKRPSQRPLPLWDHF